MSSSWDAWNYRDSAARAAESGTIVGYRVHASDGDIGKVDEASNVVDESSIVVDTGPWIFGRKVYIDLTKAQIKDSPEVDETTPDDSAHRDRLGTYYGEFYR